MQIPKLNDRPRLRRALVWGAGAIVAFGVLGFLAAPPLVRYFAQKQLTELLQRQVTIEDIAINPYALSATVRGFDMKERGGGDSVAKFDELYVNLETESLLRGGVVVQAVTLANPLLRIVRNEDGSYNFGDLIEMILKQPPSEEPARFSVNNIRLTGGRVEFDDRALKATHAVADIQIGLPFVSNLPSKVEIHVEPAFGAVVDGAPLALTGKARPFSETKEAHFEVNLDGLDLPKYAAYSPVPLNFALPSGKLDSRLTVTFSQPRDGPPALHVAGSAGLEKIELTEKGGAPVLKLPALTVSLKSLDVFGGRAEVDSVNVQNPELWLRRGKDGQLSVLSLLPKAPAQPADKAEPKPAAKPAAPFRFSVADTKLAGAKVQFRDEAVDPAFEARVDALDLTVKNLSNAEGQSATVDLGVKTAAGEAIKHTGTLTLAPLAAKGRLELAGLKIPNYAPYYRDKVLFGIVSGALDASAGYEVTLAGETPKVLLDALGVRLTDVKLRRPDEKTDFYQLGSLEVVGGKVDLGARSVAIESVTTKAARLQVVRDKDGTMSVQRLFPVAAAAAEAGKAEEPWTVDIAKVATDGYDIFFEDRALAEPVKLSLTGIQTAVENLSNRKGAQTRLAFAAKINKRGNLKLTGTGGLDPRQFKLAIDLRGIDILPFQPYFADRINATVTKGAVSARGNLAVELPDQAAPKLSYRGDAGVDGFHLVDNANSTDLLVWKSLFVGGINLASIQPLKLDIRDVSLSEFYSRLIIDPDGRFNLQQVVRGDKAAEPAPPAEAGKNEAQPAPAATAPQAGAPASAGQAPAPLPQPQPPDYKITVQQVTLQGGRVNFSDRFIRPNYSADMEELGGRVAGLSSDLGTTADVELRGKVSDAPLEILGKVNPLSGNLFLDIKASVKGMELAPFTPYSGKYAGYAIDKGKLSVTVGYKVENRKLEAQNNVFLDQLTFGEKVESPDATKLPVLLAVSLLKNSRGEIDINLPIGGSLDDPEFSVGGIIVKVIVNLIVKAVTAPFALLGSMFGGGEELAYVEFDYGRAAIGPDAEKKLQPLTKALLDRPGLKLEIAGRIDPANDREGLKKAAVERKVKAQKLNDLVKKGEQAGSADDVTVGKEEYAKYLERAYKQEKFPKPRNMVGFAKDLPPEEMEKLMLTHAEVGEEDLRQLANRRAEAVKEYLAQQGKLPEERLFLVKPNLSGEEAKDKGKTSRVDFSLK